MAAPPEITGFSISLPGQISEGQIYVGQILKPLITRIPPTTSVNPFTLSTSSSSLVYDSSGNLRLTEFISSISTVSLFATDDNYSGSITLTTNPSVVSIAFDSSGQTVAPFYTLDLSSHLNLVVSPGDEVLPVITWTSSKPTVADIDANGLLTGFTLGVTKITASVTDYRTFTATLFVTVTPNINRYPREIISAEIFVLNTKLYENVTAEPRLVIDPPYSYVSSIEWSVSTPTTAYIDPSTGIIRVVNASDPYSPGSVRIQATLTDFSSNIISTSVSIPCYKSVTAIVLNPPCITSLQIGQSVGIQAILYPTNVAFNPVTWTSSDTNIAIVYYGGIDGTGRIYYGIISGISNGICSITATSEDGRASARAIVCVDNGLATVTSNVPSTLNEGSTFQVILTPLGSNNSIGSYSTVFWKTTDSAVATISNSGLITAIAAGTCDIQANLSGQSGSNLHTITITVVRSVKNMVVSPASLSLLPTESRSLSLTLFPSNPAVSSITWSSSNPSVATVNSSGLVTGVKLGRAKITAVADGGDNIVSDIPVVVGLPITSAEIVIPSTIIMGTTAQARVSLEPAGAAYDFISWGPRSTEKTNPEISQFAQITGNGLFIPNIPLLSSLVTQSNSFHVILGNQFTSSLISTLAPAITIVQPVSAIQMTEIYYTKTIGSTFQPSLTIYPSSAHNKALSWSSSDRRVARVDSSGNVTTYDLGDAIITATAVDSGTISAITVVNVTI